MNDWPEAYSPQGEKSDWPNEQSSWQQSLSGMLAGQTQPQPQQSQPMQTASSRMMSTTPTSSQELDLSLPRYGELNKDPYAGKKFGLLNDPYHKTTTKDYGVLLGNMLAPTQGGASQAFGDQAIGHQIYGPIDKVVNYLPDRAQEIAEGEGPLAKFAPQPKFIANFNKKSGLGRFLARGNPFEFFNR